MSAEVGTSAHWKAAESLNATFRWYDFVTKPWDAEQEAAFDEISTILTRAMAYAKEWLDLETSAPAPHAYRGAGTLKLDFGTFRRYPPREVVAPHLDTDKPARCMSRRVPILKCSYV